MVNTVLDREDISHTQEDLVNIAEQFEQPLENRHFTIDRSEIGDTASRRLERIEGDGTDPYYVRHNMATDLAATSRALLDEMAAFVPVFDLYARVVTTDRQFQVDKRVSNTNCSVSGISCRGSKYCRFIHLHGTRSTGLAPSVPLVPLFLGHECRPGRADTSPGISTAS